MAIFKIYLRVQLVILIIFGFLIIHNYRSYEPVTRLLIDSTWMVLAYKAGVCSESCYQAWQQKNQASPETHQALQKLIRWVTSSPTLTRFVVARVPNDQKKQLLMITTLSKTTPEASALFESTYGISPEALQKFLSE